mmetsp:Transcript_1384/g.3814  ORF Transcript_1384/g.3814 Transcript_1384/m.3814 type:complete len:589 (-) Transcript_1384:496-2262(-)|eukprot:CAMPEP_0113554650 /NCGR_PEP_ID=MMETSP0015_2-20120614/16270_1 /TAXON_ID=2838 /ORGANISM="Odontella" /LENGTH=588 /DNA_ID=CAMNT_0000455821 /DNA_START=45 /DNA_END=1811 /DNA_ORIENTATION=- /assembly_acc=CAM_ASM_000160
MSPKESKEPSALSSTRGRSRYRWICGFLFVGVIVLAAILLSVFLSKGRKQTDPTTGVSNAMPGGPSMPGGNYGASDDEPYPWGDEFANLTQNEVIHVCDEPVSTFSADVDTTSYSFCRRMLNNGDTIQPNAVRAEEMINYFDYAYPLPVSEDQPFEPTVMVSNSPWNLGKNLLHIGIKGFDIVPTERRPSNIVFLIDCSGSMGGNDRLPLVKESIKLLLATLSPQNDAVAIVTYSSEVKVVLEPTFVYHEEQILEALHQLEAGGGTSGAGGLALAYDLAEHNFNANGVNRIILATDGDFNIGTTNNDDLETFVSKKREKGIFLSVLGFGYGNYKDSRMKALANNGNGVAVYIDTINEAKKVLVTEAQATLFPIAKDVKFQLAFNPSTVSGYRLIGYEKRLLQQEDFDDDTVDAGEIGSGHTVTVLYEFDPVPQQNSGNIDEICNGTKDHLPGTQEEDQFPEFEEDDFASLKIRYKAPDEDTSNLITRKITKGDTRLSAGVNNQDSAVQSLRGSFANSHVAEDVLSVYRDFDWATAVAGFAQVLRGGELIDGYSYDDIILLAERSKGEDLYGYREEFIMLVQKAKQAQQ